MTRIVSTLLLQLLLLTAPHVGADIPVDMIGARRPPVVVIKIPDEWPMWGRAPTWTFYTPALGPPFEWDVAAGQNIRWTAPLGSTTYGTPAVCNGVVYVGTNNDPG